MNASLETKAVRVITTLMSVCLVTMMNLHSQQPAEVVALSQVLMDRLVTVDDAFISEHVGGEKGSWELIDHDRLGELVDLVPGSARMTPGGSGVNMLKGMARLGWRCRLIGNVGEDGIGKRCVSDLKGHDIDCVLAKEPLPTGQVLCMVTPDHDRTMRTFIGAAGVTDNISVERKHFEGVHLMHIDGYLYCDHDLVEKAARHARDAGCLVAIGLGSFEMVRAHHDFLNEFIPQYVDIVIANAAEATELTGLPPAEAAIALSRQVRVVVVTTGAEGCLVAAGGQSVLCPCVSATPVDTTGAGDLFASGFLHGYLRGESLQQCGLYGNTVAARCIEQLGASLTDRSWQRVKQGMEEVHVAVQSSP